MASSGIVDITKWAISAVAALLVAALFLTPARAQSVEPKSPAEARLVVVGEGSVTVAPDYVRIKSGVSTYAKTVKEARDTNIQTSEFSIEPAYASPTPPGGPKLSGYRVSNQVNVTIHQISQVGEILDRGPNRCDRCREHSVSHFRPRESARPGARGHSRQC